MYLSTSEGPENARRGFIDHLTVCARAGFDEDGILALQRLRRLWARNGHDLELIPIGLGSSSDFGGFEQPSAPVFAESCIWESVTPFVPTRHPNKVRGTLQDSVEDQLRRGCIQLLGAAPAEVSPVKDRAFWSAFRRRSFMGGGRRGLDAAFGARLVFDTPVRGPIAIGYGAHFGLGVFSAVT